ncbi:MAG: radical SAM protein [Clostridiales bacterium GWB2_37_7]|nr:MAG: radical SAM protein [Clostridiales bacterium GWB2_37_7]
MVKPIKAKIIVSTVKQDNWFGLKYNMNLYRGCQHGCIYCDSRSSCYGIEDFEEIQYKENALELLDKELRGKKVRGTIGTGSMHDPYMPAEKELKLTRRALEIIKRHRFPVHVLTKSTLVLRDIDLLREISRAYAAISITITTADDKIAKLVEPCAPSSSERFAAVKELSDQGLYTGILLMPILPYINDTEENIIEIVKKAKEAGAKYILTWMGVTLRDRQKAYYYKQLDKSLPGLRDMYIKSYGDAYFCPSINQKKLYELLQTECDRVGIKTNMDFYKPIEAEQLTFL